MRHDDSRTSTVISGKTIFIVYLFACSTLDFFPRYAPPKFRYTGSNPTVPVWNLGWPLALTIYDPQRGLQVGPSIYWVLPLQLFLLAAGCLIVVTARRMNNRILPWIATNH